MNKEMSKETMTELLYEFINWCLGDPEMESYECWKDNLYLEYMKKSGEDTPENCDKYIEANNKRIAELEKIIPENNKYHIMMINEVESFVDHTININEFLENEEYWNAFCEINNIENEDKLPF